MNPFLLPTCKLDYCWAWFSAGGCTQSEYHSPGIPRKQDFILFQFSSNTGSYSLFHLLSSVIVPAPLVGAVVLMSHCDWACTFKRSYDADVLMCGWAWTFRRGCDTDVLLRLSTSLWLLCPNQCDFLHQPASTAQRNFYGEVWELRESTGREMFI